jgi:mycofactocin glycosyltransferase
VQKANGEILAFLDDDCVAGRTWLRDLTQYFQWEGVGVVGGYVDGYSKISRLDRYEENFSLLKLGKYILRGAKDQSTFFVPTCNMLVRKQAFVETGGIRGTMRLGEDVDFCWRMSDAGWQALYVPAGTVMHKHKNTLGAMLRRRADYGTSEAILSTLNPHRPKTLQMRPLATVAFLFSCCAIIFLTFLPLVVIGVSFVAETALKSIRLRRKRIRISVGMVCSSVLRMYISYFFRCLSTWSDIILFYCSCWILPFILCGASVFPFYSSQHPWTILSSALASLSRLLFLASSSKSVGTFRLG